MRFFNFLTSRGFALFILCVCLSLLILITRHPPLYSPALLIAPAFLFLSILFCAGKRFFGGGNRRDIRFLGSIAFHAGMLAVIAVTAVGFFTRFLAIVNLPQDVDVNLDNAQFVSILSTPAGGHVPFISMRLVQHEARYEREMYPVEYAARLSIDMLDGTTYRRTDEVIKVNQPLWRRGYQFMLAGATLSPLLILKDRNGWPALYGFVNISNSTDKEDVLAVKKAGLTLYTRFFPDVYKDGNKYGTRSPQPKNPAIGIRVERDADPFRDVWKGVVKKGEKAEFDGMTFEFADLKPVATVYVTKDFSYWGVFASWGLIVAGLVVRYLSYVGNPHNA